MSSFGTQLRRARWAAWRSRGSSRTALMPLAASLVAVGEQGWSDAGAQQVPLDAVVGTAARAQDFDRSMRPLHRHLRRRWERVAAAAPAGLDPVRLVQAGGLYFVVDGHHRVSVARANGSPAIDALVRRVCTVAWACRCVSLLDLPVKAAERQFLERYPLPDDVRPWLWLDRAADWARVEADARAWAGSREDGVTQDGGTQDDAAAAERAATWWEQEVVPSAHRCRGTADGPAELRDHLCALRLRDARGCCVA